MEKRLFEDWDLPRYQGKPYMNYPLTIQSPNKSLQILENPGRLSTHKPLGKGGFRVPIFRQIQVFCFQGLMKLNP